MKIHRPSPALVISIVALVVALGGTATAASVLIKNSSQIRSGAVNSGDIRNGSVQGVDIRSGAVGDRQLKNNAVTQDKLSASLRSSLRGGSSGFTATEVVRKAGPDNQAPGQRVVATMTQLPAGTYALYAKTTLSPIIDDQGLGELFRQTKTGDGHCQLDAAGDVDDARTTILSPYSQHPSTVNLQMTRTIDTPIDVKLVCDSNIPWKASDTSIIALKLQGSSRSDTAG
jgi:hypothetical protein